ncbi:MAG: hypothetical protein K8S99_05795 [Planctomycetes bacterium]|nr:hypothetical protein [Planctomycetota bacterium]
MHIIFAGCVDPVVIFSFVGALIVSIFSFLTAVIGALLIPVKERRRHFTWFSIACGIVVMVIAGWRDALFGSDGLCLTIPLGLGIASLLLLRRQRPVITDLSDTTKPPRDSQ